MPILRDTFGSTDDGVSIDRFTLTNTKGGLAVEIMNYGGTLLALRVPDRTGTLGDVLLGFETLAPYLDEQPYLGALIGRYANRIAEGQFTLNGATYMLRCNNGPNHLHGGPNGFHRQVWQARELSLSDGASLELRYLSRDGEEGYPGNLHVKVVYALSERDELRIDYEATTDEDTIINLTNHAYFNLGGDTILDHELTLKASHFLPIDSTFIPLGELRAVRATPMDFTLPVRIGARHADDDEQLRRGLGYDHTWVFDKEPRALDLVARLYAPATGRAMEIFTTQPGLQFYSGNQLDGSLIGKGDKVYVQHSGLALETHHFPDSPNHPQFPSTVLRPGEVYRETTIYRFSIQP